MRNNQAGELDVSQIRERSVKGVFSLITRSFFVQLVSFGATFFLTVFLDPKIFGVFFLVSAFVNFFTYFSDIGLAAALIQKKEKINDEDLKTTFFVQQVLVLLLILIIVGLSGRAQSWYNLDQPSLYLVYALALSFFLSSLKTIPSVMLERQLKFDLLIIPQIAETLIFNLVAVFLAWKGNGISSFTIAIVARGLVGLIIIYWLSPWRIGWAFSKETLNKLLKFGLPYQANTILAVLKDDLMTVFLGGVIGTTGLGYLGWAKRWSELPLRFFMDNVSKVSFPAFSRLQNDKKSLQLALEKALFFLCFLTFPILVGFSVLASDLTWIIPRYLKWQPALVPLYLYCLNSGVATISTSMTNFLNATGQIKKTFKLMIMWLFLTWALMPLLAVKFGYQGVAVSTVIISLSSYFAVWFVRKTISFNIWSTIILPLLSSLAMGLSLYFIRPPVGNIALSIFIRAVSGSIVYFLVSALLFKEQLFEGFRFFYVSWKKKN